MAQIFATNWTILDRFRDGADEGYNGAASVTSHGFQTKPEPGVFATETFAYVSGPVDQAIQVFSIADDGTSTAVASVDVGTELSRVVAYSDASGGAHLLGIDTGSGNLGLGVFDLTLDAPYVVHDQWITDTAGTNFSDMQDVTVANLGPGKQFAVVTSRGEDSVTVISLNDADFGTEIDQSNDEGNAAGLTGPANLTSFYYDNEQYVAVTWDDDATITIHRVEDDGNLVEVAALSTPALAGVGAIEAMQTSGGAMLYTGSATNETLVILSFDGTDLDIVQSVGPGTDAANAFANIDALEIVEMGDASMLAVSGIGNPRANLFDIETNSLSPLFGTLSPRETGVFFYNATDLHHIAPNNGFSNTGTPIIIGTSPLSDNYATAVFGSLGEILDGTAHSDTIRSYGGDDFIRAGGGSDSVDAGDGDNVVYAQDGNDQIRVGNGDDIVFGNQGDDVVYAATGDDQYFGGRGRDAISYGGLNGDEGGGSITRVELMSVKIDLTKKSAVLSNGDKHVVRGFEDARGSSGNDLLKGTSGANDLVGLDGRDKIIGGGGNDDLFGGGGNDNLRGGGGNDMIRGGVGNDTMRGDGGRDTFVFSGGESGKDRVLDFRNGQDLLELRMFSSFAEAKAAAKNTKAGLKFTWENVDDEGGPSESGVITVSGLTLRSFDAGDLI